MRVILCLVMLLALMPVTALAEEPGRLGRRHDDRSSGRPSPDDELKFTQ